MASLSPHSCGRCVLTTTAAIAIGLMLAQCSQPDADRSSPARSEPSDAAGAPDLTPVPTTTLGRADLLNAARMAEQSYAGGNSPDQPDPLLGRAFAVRMAFGCDGPSAAAPTGADGLAHWAWGPDRRTIRIRLAPADWTVSNLLVPSGVTALPSNWEAIEGFWVPRPWLTGEGCPTRHPYPLQPALGQATPQTLGLAAVFDAEGSRLGRRNGKAYEFTVRTPADQPLVSPERGYRLLLEGRIVGFPGGRAIRCGSSGPDQRPVCIAAVQLDKVAFEDASGATLSEWRPG